ncbi:hypothetical protein NOV72_02105 [Caballeronia novacaledonica]|uniref:Uncharacterized protein n=1 Tax=Caballeronia novacaledonica TaxID=1544861 RepID=A0A2U3I432_9BURK|nr:hypothetical protein [Caballeronia novacaledonica]SPB14874.1 hypothetical protein NOV72_02105 [Caballeronia novacaledonica]
MSVVFVACKGLQKFNGIVDDDFRRSHFEVDAVEVEVNTDWPCLADGLEAGAVYMYEEDGRFGFKSRLDFFVNLNELAAFVGYDCGMPPEDDPKPFRELFRWRGEGIIGPVVSAKLAADFAEWDEPIKALGDDDFYKFYLHMRKIFGFAMNDGCVSLQVVTERQVAC